MWRQLRLCAQPLYQLREVQCLRQRHRSVAYAAPVWVWFCTQRKQEGRCGVTLGDCCCGSRDVAASNSQTAVAAAETLRRPFGRLLLRQQRRCGVTLEDCCCGRRDVAASHSADCCCGSRDVAASNSQTLLRQTAVAAAETLRRHTRRLLLRQQGRCGVKLTDCCCGSRRRGVTRRLMWAAETLGCH